MSASVFAQYADGELHRVSAPKPDSFRAGLYLYARRHDMKAKSFIIWDTLPYPIVVFRLGAGTLEPLPDAPSRGAHSHSDYVPKVDHG